MSDARRSPPEQAHAALAVVVGELSLALLNKPTPADYARWAQVLERILKFFQAKAAQPMEP